MYKIEPDKCSFCGAVAVVFIDDEGNLVCQKPECQKQAVIFGDESEF
jgi:hypothetical protein